MHNPLTPGRLDGTGNITTAELNAIRDQTGRCPGPAAGCRCTLHTDQPTILRVVTPGRPPLRALTFDTTHNGTMTCPCAACAAERASRPALGAGPAQLRPRPPRHLRNAA